MDKKELALLLFDRGVVEFGEFQTKIHKCVAGTPSFPMRFNFESKAQGGRLSGEIICLIGSSLSNVCASENIIYDCVAGIPPLGVLFADFFASLTPQEIVIAALSLEERDGEIELNTDPTPYKGQRALLIDAVTENIERVLKIAKILSRAGIIAEDCLVVVEYDEGEKKELEEGGIVLHSLFKREELLNIYLEAGRISSKQKQQVLSYSKDLQDFLLSRA